MMKSIIYLVVTGVIWILIVSIVLLYQHTKKVSTHLSKIVPKSTFTHQQSTIDQTIELSQSKTYFQSKSHETVQSIASVKPSNFIIFDWPYDSDLLSYLNYKSLESYLSCCHSHSTQVEIMIIASPMANYYKLDNILSIQTFQKYEKKGYNMKTVVYSTASSLMTFIHTLNETKNMIGYGQTYFQEEFHRVFKDSIHPKDSYKILTALHFYGRILRLYSKGGEFYDLSWFHQKKLGDTLFNKTNSNIYPSNIRQGFYMIPFCYNTTTSILHRRPHLDTSSTTFETIPLEEIELRNRSDYQCASSTIMYFPYPKSPVLECILDEYEASTSGLQNCLARAIHKLLIALQPYEQSLCVKRAFDRCFGKTRIRNDLKLSPIISSVHPTERHYMGTNISLLSNTEAINRLPFSPMLWLGPEALSGQWVVPSPNSYLHNRILENNQMMKSFSYQTALLLGSAYSNRTASCSHYPALESSLYPEPIKRRINVSCALSYVIPGFMKTGSSYLFEMLSRHPQIITPIKGVVFKETGCYQVEILIKNTPGSRMNCFPFVEKDEPYIFGDGTVSYLMGKLFTAEFLQRENPNLKSIILIRDPIDRMCSQHRFLYDVYQRMNLGDINIVVDIALSPNTWLDRLYQKACVTINELYSNHSSNKRSIESLQQLLITYNEFKETDFNDKKYQRAVYTFYHSLYFPAIFLWDRIFGEESSYVIETDRISVTRSVQVLRKRLIENGGNRSILTEKIKFTNFIMQKTLEEELNDIFRFLGLNPYRIQSINSKFAHKTVTDIIPEHQLSPSSKIKVAKFFKPFNELLTLYLYQRAGDVNRAY